jgi:Acetyltransferases
MGQQTLEVERIYIRKNYKRHGLGKYLINYAIDMSQKCHKKRIWLGVWEHNEPAKSLSTHGFKKVSEHNFN